MLIDALQGQQDMRDRVARELRSRALATTTVNAFELLSGARSPSAARHVSALVAALRVLPIDRATIRANFGRARSAGYATLTREDGLPFEMVGSES